MISNDEIKTNVLQSGINCNWRSQCLVNLRSHILVGMSFMGKVSRETTKQKTEASLVLSHVQEAHLSVEQFVPCFYIMSITQILNDLSFLLLIGIAFLILMFFLCVFLVDMNMYIVWCLIWNAFTGLQSYVCLASRSVSYPFCNMAEPLPTLSEKIAR